MAATPTSSLPIASDTGVLAAQQARATTTVFGRLSKPTGVAGASPRSNRFGAWSIGSLVRQRRVLVVTALLLVAAGVVFGQQWLAATGMLPLLISALPCLAMCALGLCMQGQGGQACGSPSAPQAGSAARLNAGESQS